MTTTSFLRGAKCRLGACDEVGEGNQERRVVSNSRQTPDCRVMRSSLIHGDPGFNWGSGSSKGRCIRRVWGARMGPEEFSTQIYSTKRRKKGAESAGARGFLMLMIVSASWSTEKLISAVFVFFSDGKKTTQDQGVIFFWNSVKLKQPTHHRQVLTACSNSSQPSRGLLFQPVLVTWRCDDFDRAEPLAVLTLKVFENFNRMSCLDSTSVEGCYLNWRVEFWDTKFHQLIPNYQQFNT